MSKADPSDSLLKSVLRPLASSHYPPILESVGKIKIDAVIKSSSTQDLFKLQAWVAGRRLTGFRPLAMGIVIRQGVLIRLIVKLIIIRILVQAVLSMISFSRRLSIVASEDDQQNSTDRIFCTCSSSRTVATL